MALTRELLLRIRQEIENDPEGVGYAGKTDAEILSLLNNAVRKQKTVEDVFPSPINRILTTIPEIPNVISLTELQQAKIII